MSSNLDPFDYVYKPTMQEWACGASILVSIVGLYYLTLFMYGRYKERQLMIMSLESPGQLYLLISGSSVASNHEFAVAMKKEMDFSAKWFKDRPKEEIEPHTIETESGGTRAQGIRSLLYRSMGDEDYFLLKFSEAEHDILIKNMERVIRVKRSINMLMHWS